MANKASKTSKTSNPPVNTFRAAINACESVILDGLLALDSATKTNQEAAKSRSSAMVAAVASLYASIPDAGEYQKAVAVIFGNGERGKKNVPGELAEKLKAANVAVTVRAELSRIRTVAANFGNADVRKAATESGVRAGYDAAKPKAEAEPKAAEKPDAKPVTLPELIGQMVATLGGDVSILRMVESALIAAKKPIHAAAVHDAAVKLTTLSA